MGDRAGGRRQAGPPATQRAPGSALDDVIAVADDDVTAVAAEAAPARPEDERDQHAGDPDDHEDHADDLDVEAVHVGAHGPGEDRTDGDEDETCTETHFGTSCQLPRLRAAHWRQPPV